MNIALELSTDHSLWALLMPPCIAHRPPCQDSIISTGYVVPESLILTPSRVQRLSSSARASTCACNSGASASSAAGLPPHLLDAAAATPSAYMAKAVVKSSGRSSSPRRAPPSCRTLRIVFMDPTVGEPDWGRGRGDHRPIVTAGRIECAPESNRVLLPMTAFETTSKSPTQRAKNPRVLRAAGRPWVVMVPQVGLGHRNLCQRAIRTWILTVMSTYTSPKH